MDIEYVFKISVSLVLFFVVFIGGVSVPHHSCYMLSKMLFFLLSVCLYMF